MKPNEIIQSYYTAFNQKNNTELLKLLTDDVIHDINQGERQIGKVAFTKFMNEMDHAYDEILTDMSILVSTDEKRASAEFVCSGTYKESVDSLPSAKGQTYKIAVGAFFELRDGKIARVTNYYNMNEWIKQVR